jgi:protein import protein ZIM17
LFSSYSSDKNNEGIPPPPATTKNNKNDDNSPVNIPGSQTGGKKLAIIFTCTVCDTRSAKQFTENAYRNGVVIVKCPGCQSQHLIADNLGFFEDQEDGGWNIEKAMAKMGDNVKVVTDDNVFEVNIEDLVGKDAINKAVNNKTGEDNSK